MSNIKELFIIDDDNVYTFVATKIIEKTYPSIKINVFFSPIEALKNLQSRQKGDLPQLILLDIVMPDMDGMDFYQEVKKINNSCQIKIVIHTAVMNEKELNLYRKKNFKILGKPLNIEELKELMK